MRISNAEFLKKSLRVHSFLNDVPLHDAWVFRLKRGGEERTLDDFQALFSEVMSSTNLIVKGLFKLRFAIGSLFGWDDSNQQIPSASYIHRLNPDDKASSLRKPGSRTMGPFHQIYAFENETLEEVINKTVHAFSAMAMEPREDVYRLYWAIYVKRVNRFTPVYMTLIDPFRRLSIDYSKS